VCCSIALTYRFSKAFTKASIVQLGIKTIFLVQFVTKTDEVYRAKAPLSTMININQSEVGF
jgi:hypothetical protein